MRAPFFQRVVPSLLCAAMLVGPRALVAQDTPEAIRARAAASLHGATGGLHLVDGSSGLPASVRLQLHVAYFRGSDYLIDGDTNESVHGALSLSATLSEHLEVFGTFHNRSNSNSLNRPVLLQVVGDTELGFKGYTEVAPWVGVSADLRVLLLNQVGDLGYAFGGTSVGLRTAATFDLRRIDEPLPVILRGNLEYFIDNTAELIADLEDVRYDALPVSERRTPLNEDRHLVTRIERLAFGVNRVDMLSIGLGAELPLRAADDFYVHPLLEWRIGFPINRQGYNCLAVTTDAGAQDVDGCLGVVGMSAAPSTVTLGVRALPPVRGVSASVGVDIGVSGSSTFARELAPTLPWALLIALQYGADGRQAPTEAPVAVAAPAAPLPPPPPAPTAPQRMRVAGIVVVQGTDTPVAGATLRYVDRDLTAQLSGDDGRFTTYELEPGSVGLMVSHPSFEATPCTVVVAVPSAGASGLSPVGLDSADGAAAQGGTVRCELAQPAPEQEVAVVLPPVEVAPAPVAEPPPPPTPQVVLTARELRLRKPILFARNGTEIDERSLSLMREIADMLIQNPQVARVQVQGHTDNSGEPARNQRVSEQRAEAVLRWLVNAGVAADRLEAKGYGDTRPLAPNITDANRARNRRVQLVIK
jgi:OmpA-OmpF porin, OOP family